MSEKEYKVPSRKQPIFTPIKAILRLFYKKPKITINLAGDIENEAIIVMNHSGKSGPMAFELHYPKFNVKWGAHEMLGGYRSRFRYLRDVYYIQKKGYNRFIATLLAGFEAVFSKMFYTGMKFIPTYQDMRFKGTIENSLKVLDSGYTITIFPENSDEGYKEVLTEFNPGFILLAESYKKTRGKDVPIYPVYYHLKKRKLVIGKPEYLQDVKETKSTRAEIAEHFLNRVNGLFFDYIKDN